MNIEVITSFLLLIHIANVALELCLKIAQGVVLESCGGS